MTRKAWTFLGVSLAFAVATAPAVAEPLPADGKWWFEEGTAALKRHSYEEALSDFGRSLAIARRGSVLRGMALAEWHLGKRIDAMKHLREALQSSTLPAELREAAKQDFDEAYKATGHVEIDAPQGANVTVDGQAVGTAPLADSLDVEVGARTIEARLGDWVGHTELDARPGVLAHVTLVAQSPEPAAPPAASQGQAAAPEAPPREPRSSGRPTNGGGSPETFWTGRHLAGALVGMAGVVSLVASSAYFIQWAADRDHGASLSCGGMSDGHVCAALSEAHSAQRADVYTVWTLVGVGALGVVSGGALLFWPGGSKPQVGLSVQGGALGLQLQGAW
jgi:hypothetical protein